MSEEQVLHALLEQAEADPIGAFGEVGSWDYITKDERKAMCDQPIVSRSAGQEITDA